MLPDVFEPQGSCLPACISSIPDRTYTLIVTIFTHIPRFPSLLLLLMLASLTALAQKGQWTEQPTEVPVRGLMGISMADTGNGYAVGDVDILLNYSGVLVKRAGDPTWRLVSPSAFNPPINIGLTSWAQDIHAVPNTGTAFISWRDDYRSLVYKTIDFGRSWYSVSPLNPILYGTRYRIRFKDAAEGLIVGEGPGRVHRTTDGGRNWVSYTVPTSRPLTDAFYADPYWYIIGGDNVFFRFQPSTGIWANFSFQQSPEYFPERMTMHFVDQAKGYFTGYNSNSASTLMFTSNGGVYWQAVAPGPGFPPNPEGHKGIFFFDSRKGWVTNAYNEIAYTNDGGGSWSYFTPVVFGSKVYEPITKLVFLNESIGWASGGRQRTDGYPSVSYGYILKWEGEDKPNISTTPVLASFDTLACGEEKPTLVTIRNSGTGLLTMLPGDITFNSLDIVVAPNQLPLTISPGEEQDVRIDWRPPANFLGAIPDSVVMRIASNDVEHSPWEVRLEGWREQSRFLPAGVQLDFPTVCAGDTARFVFAASVFGNAAPVLVDEEGQINQGWMKIVSPAKGQSIADGDSIVVILRSTAGGTVTGSLHLVVGNPNCPEDLLLPVSGLFSSNSMILAPPVLNFGDQCTGRVAEQWVQLASSGNIPGSIRAVEHMGGSNAFTVVFDSAEYFPPSGLGLVKVRFNPGIPDSNGLSVRKRLILGPCLDTLELVCTGRSVGARFDPGPDTLIDLSPVPVGKTLYHDIRLVQRGIYEADLQSVEFVPPVNGLGITVDRPLPAGVIPGDTLRLRMSYRTTVVDSFYTLLRLRWGGPCPDTLYIPVILRSDELPVIVAPPSFDMGLQQCAESVFDSVFIHNAGRRPLSVLSMTLDGKSRTHFRVLGPNPPFDVPAGDSAAVRLRYNAPSNGVSEAVLVLAHNDFSVAGETRIDLRGERLVRELSILGDTTSPMLSCAGDSTVRILTLRNSNSQPVELTTLTLDRGAPEFRLSGPPLPVTLGPGEWRAVRVSFVPSGPFSRDAEVRMHTEPCGTERIIGLTGTQRTASLVITTYPIMVGTRSTLEIDTIPVWAINRDSIPVVLDTVLLRGTGGRLTLVDPAASGTVIPPGDSIRVLIALTGKGSEGTLDASLCFGTRSPCDEEECCPVTGRFIDAGIVAVPDSLLFLFNDFDTLRCDSLRVFNMLSVDKLLDFQLTDSTNFQLRSARSVELGPGESCLVEICATRTDGQARLLISDARGVVTDVVLVAVRDTVRLDIPGQLWCGNIPWCVPQQSGVLKVVNAGRAELTVEVVQQPAAPFSVPGSGSLSIRPGQSGLLEVAFSPTVDGAYTGSMMLRITRGDCTELRELLLSGRRSRDYLTLTPSVLIYNNVVAGTTQVRPVDIRNLDMAGLRLAEISISPPDMFDVAAALPMAIDSGTALSLPVSFRPTAPGNYFADLCLIFDAPCADTVCLSMEGLAIEGHLLWDVSDLRFAAMAQCETDTATVRLRNDGAGSVQLMASGTTGPNAAEFDVLNPVSTPEALSPGAERTFLVRCLPAGAGDGPLSATLFVTTNDPMQNVVELPLAGERVTQQTPAGQTLDFGVMTLGIAANADVVLRNTGSASLSILQYITPPGVSLAPPPPYSLPPGDSLRITVTVIPLTVGGMADSLVLSVLQPCDDFIVLPLRGQVLPAVSLADLNLGAVAWCDEASGISVLRNNLPEDVTLLGLEIVGQDAAAFSLIQPPGLPLDVPHDGSVELTVLFRPPSALGGLRAATLRAILLKGGTQDTVTATLSAEVFDGMLEASSPFDFGVIQAGTSVQRTLTLRNTGPLPVRIASLQAPGSPFGVVDAVPAPPVELLPGDSCDVVISFAPGVPGAAMDSLLVQIDGPCPLLQGVELRGEGAGDVVPVRITLPDVAGKPDDTLLVPVMIDGPVSGLSATGWSGTLMFNPSMLHPLGVVSTGSASDGLDVSYDYSQPASGLRLSCSGGITMAGPGPLVFVRMLVLIGNDVRCTLRPSEFRFAYSIMEASDLVDGSFTLSGYCMAGSRVVRLTAGTRLEQNSPNPFASVSVLPFVLGTDGHVRIVLRDASGREIAVVLDETRSAGRHELRLDASDLPSGVYVCTMETGGISYSVKILITK